jgi:hypothetical protein
LVELWKFFKAYDRLSTQGVSVLEILMTEDEADVIKAGSMYPVEVSNIRYLMKGFNKDLDVMIDHAVSVINRDIMKRS